MEEVLSETHTVFVLSSFYSIIMGEERPRILFQKGGKVNIPPLPDKMLVYFLNVFYKCE